jgi:hypothetical protein
MVKRRKLYRAIPKDGLRPIDGVPGRRPGREFGAVNPSVIYLALRWNSDHPTVQKEQRLIQIVAQRLRVRPETLRVFNLVRPGKDRGMTLNVTEFRDASRTIRQIHELALRSNTLTRVVVGGASGPMPGIALLLWHLLPSGVRIDLRTHHRARQVTGGPLARVRVLRSCS